MAKADIKVKLTLTGIQEFQKGLRQLSTEAKKFGKSFGKLGAASKKLGRNLAIAGGAATAGIAQAFSEFTKFEDALIGVGKTTTLTAEELKQLGDNAKVLSVELGVSAAELLNVAQTAGQLGVDGVDDLTKFTETIAKLNTATDTLRGEEAATTLARLLGIAGEGVEDVDRLASVIVQLGNTFKATEGEIADTALEILSAGTALGFTTAESVGLAAAFAELKIEPALAASVISKTFAEIAEAINEGGEQLEEFQLITGLTSQQLATAFEETPVQLFQTFVEGLAKINTEEGALGLAQTLKNVELNARTLVKTLPKLAVNNETVAKGVADANVEWAANNALNEEFSRRTEATSFKLLQLGIAFQNLRIEIGEQFGPVFTRVFNGLRDAIKTISPVILPFFEELAVKIDEFVSSLGEDPEQLQKTFKSLFEGIGAFITALSSAFSFLKDSVFKPLLAFLDIIGGFFGKDEAGENKISGGMIAIVLAAGSLSGAFAFLAAAIGLIGPTIGIVNAALLFMAANPLVLLIVTLVAVAGTIAFLIEKFIGWGNIIEFLGKQWDLFTELLGLAIVFMGDLVAGFVDSAIAKFKEFIDSVVNFFKELPSNIATVFSEMSNIVAAFIDRTVQFFLSLPSKIIEAFISLGTAIIDSMKSAIDSVLGFFTNLIDAVLSKIKTVANFISRLFGRAKEEAKQVIGVVNEIGPSATVVQTLASGGLIRGPGTGTSDSIPLMGSDGEFMMRAKSVRKFGTNFMHMINKGILPKFADGGLISATTGPAMALAPIVSGGGPAKVQRPLNLILPSGEVIKTFTDESTAKRLERDLRRSSLTKSAELPAWY